MSEAFLATLQKQVSDLTAENASLKAENKDRRIKGKAAGNELEQLRAERDTLARDRDAHKARAEAAPSELQGKIDELTGQIRTRDHRDAFASVKEFDGPDGKRYTLHPRASVDAVWTQLGYKADGETPKAEAITTRLGEALQAHPYLFAEATAPGGTTRPIAVASREAGPGGGRGTSSTVTGAPGSQAERPANYIPGRI